MTKSSEIFIMRYAGRFIEAIGAGGFMVTLFMDEIARGLPVNIFRFGWLQYLGLIVFMAIFIFGEMVQHFLTAVYETLEK